MKTPSNYSGKAAVITPDSAQFGQQCADRFKKTTDDTDKEIEAIIGLGHHDFKFIKSEMLSRTGCHRK